MRKVLAQGSVHIQATPEVCFDRYLDLASYPEWEPNTCSAEILGHGAEGRIVSVAFHVRRTLMGVPVVDLRYRLRCEHHWIPGGGFWIKFDAVEGDLDHVMTVIRLEPDPEGAPDDRGEIGTRMRYNTVVGAHYPLKLALLAPFTDRAVDLHLAAFRGWVHAAQAAAAVDLGQLPGLRAAMG